MLTIQIHNLGTGDNEHANYEYAVLINRKVIDAGFIYDHNRNNGWVKLLEMLCENKRMEHGSEKLP